jgi:hypothetical protein
MDWKQIILMAKGKAEDPEAETNQDHLFWRARIILENTIKPAVREVLEFLDDNDIPYNKKIPHYIDDPEAGIGAQLIIGDETCNVNVFIGLTKESIIGQLSEFRYVHLEKTTLLELPLNETKITAAEVKRLLAEDVRNYYEKLADPNGSVAFSNLELQTEQL